jgi:hypothetical protein
MICQALKEENACETLSKHEKWTEKSGKMKKAL